MDKPMLTFEVYKIDNNGYGIRGYLIHPDGTKEVVYNQPFNPDYLQPFPTVTDAFEFLTKIKEQVEKAVLGEYDVQPISLSITVKDESGRLITDNMILKKGTNISIKVDGSVSSDILIPLYRVDKGTATTYSMMHVTGNDSENSQFTLTINDAGEYEIDANDIVIGGKKLSEIIEENSVSVTINGDSNLQLKFYVVD